MNHTLLTTTAPAFARLFDEPDDGWRVDLDSAECLLRAEAPDAALALERFVEIAAGEPIDTLRERHAVTFDLAPVCVPYVSVHLFGDESFKRAKLMGGLAHAYRHAGFDAGAELPDHISTILRYAPRMAADEQRDLVEFVLRPAVDAMARALDGSANPYRHVVEALQSLLARCVDGEAAHA